ncbi:MAG: glucose-1-phosphate thymidylyltransferase, partial [Odoribacter sp.]|nr:glucose-1-phosphate thymidylyltransferase [Odoribacter sp.]
GANAENGEATIFGSYVKDPERFGIVEFDKEQRVVSVEEKPEKPRSNYCITGLYFYPKGVAERARRVLPSSRGELEITDLNRLYLEDKKLKVQVLGRGFAWMDTGTMDSLMEAASFVQTIQNRQGVVISAPEELGFFEGWITREELIESARIYGKSPYGEHLMRVAEDRLVY